MQRLTALLTVICVLLCLAFNYTFPLHRDSCTWLFRGSKKQSLKCDKSDHQVHIVERTKKMANDIESAFKKVINYTQDIGKNVINHWNNSKNILNGENLKQYEQLVIMKKNPYLDLKELELNYSPTSKNVRQNVKYESGPNLDGDSGICEPVEDGPSVEIINRGLSGFTIPALLKKTSNVVLENKLSHNTLKNYEKTSIKSTSQIKAKTELKDLEDDIVDFEEKQLQF